MKRIHSIIPFLVAVLFSLPVFGQSLEKELWIQNGERSIYGVLSKPESAGKRQPVAIISHGFNGTHHYGRTYFETLNALGYQAYVFDFPCGPVLGLSGTRTASVSAAAAKDTAGQRITRKTPKMRDFSSGQNSNPSKMA